jgi:hypothetical protein
MVTAVSASYFQRPVSFSYSPEIILTGKYPLFNVFSLL